MPAYLILDIHVEDPEEYAAYRERSPATLEAYGGRYLVRGGPHEVIEGDWNPERVVVVEFPSVQRAREWYESPEYQEIVGMRLRAAPSNTVLVEGVS
ncbi:MAG: hypothetical protein QOH72_2019 [Solirubrobacteraceae bacterium]|jgi:uncharacterized protein (DUF1330 family)|nr:hypothetical protein [Solirubrobacteraceae bacterium]